MCHNLGVMDHNLGLNRKDQKQINQCHQTWKQFQIRLVGWHKEQTINPITGKQTSKESCYFSYTMSPPYCPQDKRNLSILYLPSIIAYKLITSPLKYYARKNPQTR